MADNVAIRQLPTGVPGLDQVLGGGLPEFSFNLIAGAPGAGKTTLAQQIMFALSTPERPALYFTVVGEPPLKMLRYQQQFSFFDVARVNESIRYVNLSGDVVRGKPEQFTLAPTFREDFRESLYRMVAVLTGMGITMMMTAELEDSYTDLRFSPHGTAFLTDAIIMQRYIELKGQLQRVMAVVKVRGSAHSKDLRTFEIMSDGIVMGDALAGYEGLLTGKPESIG